MTLTPVNSSREQKQFIDFPHDLYQGDPNYVPELYIAQKELLSKKKNPFFEHSKAELCLAKDAQGKVIGRIAAIRNNKYNEFAGEQSGFFGMFDVVDDYEVAKALLDWATEWIKNEGLNKVIGPANFTTNDTAGLLVEGFDSPPVVQMTYNKSYYADFLERYGFTKQQDLLAYFIKSKNSNMRVFDLTQSLQERLEKRGIFIRQVNMKKFAQEVDRLHEIYVAAWDKNWGFVPPTKKEFEHLAEGMKLIIDSDFVYIAEKDQEPIGFVVAIPDVNIVTRTIKRGRLLPTGIFKLLFGKSKINRVRVILMGIKEEYRRLGIEGVFYANLIRTALDKGYDEAEASWILENNQAMRAGLERFNMKAYKRYRMYTCEL